MSKDADQVTENFEKQLDALEEIVNRMEQGDLTLEDSIKEFEQGMKLANQCQKTLSDAELRVKVLMENAMNGLADFDPESDNSISPE
jgi:exodeoxyribonuclease VII small subunit